MPWEPTIALEKQRKEFVHLAIQPTANKAELCRRFHISRKTGYKWLQRAHRQPSRHLSDRSKRPHHIHYHVSQKMREFIIASRMLHPFWGARKLQAYLLAHGGLNVPSKTTINALLKKEGFITQSNSLKHTPYHRFERSAPNELWQMDFKGYFSLISGGYCHPLVVLDDHSRFLVCLKACGNEQLETVRTALIEAFNLYGLPCAMLMDNGACWKPLNHLKYTEFTIWLMRLGIQVIHIHPYHPQTQGKVERVNRTLKTELLNGISLKNIIDCQKQFNLWRYSYNNERPHESLNLQTPVQYYEISPRRYPKQLLPLRYLEGDIIRHVDMNGYIYFKKAKIMLGKAFRHLSVAVRPSQKPKEWHIFFCQQIVKTIQFH